MKNIHILPTKQKSIYWINSKGKLCMGCYTHGSDRAVFYITSNEEIKEGDWFIATKDNLLYKRDSVKNNLSIFSTDKKIILTTDGDLIKDGVQAIPNEFLEWFVKNQSCEFVEVKLEWHESKHNTNVGYTTYKIIIPKKESKRALTEEDIFNPGNTDAIITYINKEQQKHKMKNTIFNCGDNEPADALLAMLEVQSVLSESFVNKITKPIMICTTNFKGNEELINQLIERLDQEMKWLNLFSDSFRIMVTTELKLMVIRQKELES